MEKGRVLAITADKGIQVAPVRNQIVGRSRETHQQCRAHSSALPCSLMFKPTTPPAFTASGSLRARINAQITPTMAASRTRASPVRSQQLK